MSLVVAVGLAACTGDSDDPQTEPPIDGGAADATEPGDTDGTAAPAPTGGGLFQTVKDRGRLICGVNQAVAGFGFLEDDGSYSGFDVDYCHVVAAAVLGDAEAVDFVPLSAEARFTALQSGEIDVLIRNSTWTATRDGGEGASFTATTFYDGQGVMVREDSGFSSVDDMANTTVCVLSGTTTELNLETYFQSRSVPYEPLTFEDNDSLRAAFLEDRCDGWTSDKSQLTGFRASHPEDAGGPEALVILDDVLSKEPLGPSVRDGDTEWFDVVQWSVFATMLAEEMGIDSTNIDQMLESVDPETQPAEARLLGLAEGHNPGLGLDPDFAVNIIRQVGNYGEIYERNIAPLGLPRGLNELWTNGGLHYAPPYT